MKSLSCFRGGVAAQIHPKNGREEHGLTMRVQRGDNLVASSQGVEEVGVQPVPSVGLRSKGVSELLLKVTL